LPACGSQRCRALAWPCYPGSWWTPIYSLVGCGAALISYQLAGALGTETAAVAAAGAVTAILEEAVRGFVVAAAVLTLLTGFAVARSDFETAVA
jgi:hypothetical protein